MSDIPIIVRDATSDDMDAVQAIYAHHVTHGIASFEETPPDAAEMTQRMTTIKLDGYPFRVAVQDGVIKGYSYGARYRPRPAYRFSVENSIYIDADCTRMGIGGALLEDLIEQCTARGFRQMVAVIGDSDNAASINLHNRFGFKIAGILKSVGFKHARWVDQVMMQRALGEGDKTQPRI